MNQMGQIELFAAMLMAGLSYEMQTINVRTNSKGELSSFTEKQLYFLLKNYGGGRIY